MLNSKMVGYFSSSGDFLKKGYHRKHINEEKRKSFQITRTDTGRQGNLEKGGVVLAFQKSTKNSWKQTMSFTQSSTWYRWLSQCPTCGYCVHSENSPSETWINKSASRPGFPRMVRISKQQSLNSWRSFKFSSSCADSTGASTTLEGRRGARNSDCLDILPSEILSLNF